ncbi:hypothetical protein SERLA73DRAFT_188256 [Serpula lacrymans var. lacrymans S7.3]|uniref:GST N-terminal domain-containing protein n=2 Tax=Serpula lacrymans var. lacrymans TaxID=341189 RepID=F8QB08_SERL3|nr:uncharacterized protein SERLADRAFT_478302 [Serpula lacrymans var. lacrymans S7.9]EGN94394.1 hypothetical protein SERLA73DRAFT_188256 [Serpula lacrymans var. lacrymans S7.3]EGO19877.1 hypothetical protein SERLADRAFT_478302 [Serpula lacrymans var. lacrymans S7.9]
MTINMDTKITFFDIPTTLPGSFPTSPNTWKVRLVLNYKSLAYETRWVETVDIESICRSLGIPPTTKKLNGDPKYTLPALIDHTPSPPVILSDSTPIIEYLEKAYPNPDPSRAIIPPNYGALFAAFEHHVASTIMADIYPLVIMSMYSTKGPRGQVHFRKRLEGIYGKPLEEIEAKGEAREVLWRKIEDVFNFFAGCIEKNGGEYFMGDTITLADFKLCGLLIMSRYASPNDAWVKIGSWSDGRWTRYLANFGPYTYIKTH